MDLLREDLLEGRALALAPGAPNVLATALTALGARVERMAELGDAAEDQVGEWARSHGPLDAFVYDARSSFASGDLPALVATMQQAWVATREVAVGALIDSGRPSKIVLLGPSAARDTHAEAASSALENLARTLSVEWARKSVTAVMVAPGPGCGEEELAEVICYLCSPGGDYFSGCRLEVGSPGR
jgi:NAD(P)-dependent dehydrogenase (short-subunit alcohol dehydrogenase family)